MTLAFRILAAFAWFGLCALPAQADTPLLGQGRGLDHIGIAVRDLSDATRDFRLLGFNVRPGGRFPGGLSNAVCSFGDRSYLELLSVAPNYGKEAADVGDFLKKHEGPMFLGLNTSSAKAAADALKARDFDAVGPEPGSIMTGDEKKPPPPMWYDVYTPDKPAKGKRGLTLPVFFIQYLDQKQRDADRFTAAATNHPSGALGVRAVWFAVHDLKARLDEMRGAGFAPAGRAVAFAGLRGRAVAAGIGDVNLLQAAAGSKADDGTIVAVSIAVKDLAKARALAEAATRSKLAVYDGTYGKSILLPAASTHGASIELVQKAQDSD